MEQRGFIHSMMDVKVLILYAMSRVEGTATAQKIYELCFQDDCVSYFDIQEALPQLAASGHLALLGDNTYEITAEGRETGPAGGGGGGPVQPGAAAAKPHPCRNPRQG